MITPYNPNEDHFYLIERYWNLFNKGMTGNYPRCRAVCLHSQTLTDDDQDFNYPVCRWSGRINTVYLKLILENT